MYTVWHVDKYKITFKLVINWTNEILLSYCSFLRPLAARYNWCQGPVLGRGPAVEKHWSRYYRQKWGGSKSLQPDQLFKVTQTKQLCYFSIQSPFISAHTDTDTLTSPFGVAFVCQAFRLQEMGIMGTQWGSASAIYRLQEMGIMGIQWGCASAIYSLSESLLLGLGGRYCIRLAMNRTE